MILRRACCLLLFSLAAFAQSDRGIITGVIHDSSGAIVPAAKISVVNQATKVELPAISNESGEYTIPNLQPGVYSVRVSKDGFRTAEFAGITLDASKTVRVDATLEVGAANQTVEVMASAVQVQSEDAKSATTLQNKLVNDLPLVVGGTVRTPFDLASLTPDAKNLGGDNGFVLGGGQAAAYGTSLDGVSTNTSRALSKSWVASNSPSIEAIEQFTSEVNGFKAEFGHTGGGNLTYVSKSGTNQFHGSVYEFLRNNDLDANNFFSNQAGIANSIYKQNDFGAVIGGPIWIPKVYNGRNKSFFFFSYEGFRNRTGANGTTFTVPTPEMYSGDFSKWVTSAGVQIPIYNPLAQTQNPDGSYTRPVFPGNVIPKNLFSATSLKALSVFQSDRTLAPNNGAAPGTAAYVSNNYLVTSGTQIYPVNKESIKGDHIFNGKHRISGYYGHDREHQTPGADGPATLPGLYTNYNDLVQATDVVRFSWDWTFSPTKLNHFYAGGNNWRQDHKPPQEYIGNWQSKFCLNNVPDCNDNLVNLFSGGTGNNYSTWGGQADNGSENTVYAYNDDFTWVHGKHTFKFGGMFQINHYNGFGRQCISGCVGFSYQETGVPGGSNPNAGGNAFASFLLGLADSGQIDTIRFIGQQFWYFGGYFQDDWRVNSKLVVNLGLRYDVNLPPIGLEDRWSDFSPTTPNPAANNIPGAVLFAGSGQGRVGTRRLADLWAKGFGPHLGIAYSKDSKTVFRGSYARSYGALASVSGSTHNMGFTLTQTFSNSSSGILPTYTMDQGMPAWTAPPFINPSVSNGTSVAWFQGNETTKLPAYDNFTFSIQRQVGNSIVLEAGYNGVMGEHLQTQLLQYNQISPKYLTAFGTVAQSITVLNSLVGSATANAAGITAPFPTFNTLWGSRATVAQALRPFPQYTYIDTYAGQGDHSGHSTYHALITKFQKRMSHGLTIQASYVLSKLLTDSDTAWGAGYAADFFNRGLEKSIGAYDVTHDFKFAGVYDLPFGKGQQYLSTGPAAWIIGNWRVASIMVYDSGQPVGISSSYTLPIYASGAGGRVAPYVNSYSGWQPNFNGGFDPGKYNFFVPYGSGPFPNQGTGTAFNGIGNSTRYNPKVRLFPNLNENLSLTRSFPIREALHLEFRAEAFNVFNRVRFGTGSTQLQNQQFGVLTGSGSQINAPRQLQLALKLYF
ncbi:MAG TPA: carboxypeptidase regulatory-like domain-containing protein [Candidatus Acidoferrales bacterium]|nr:carboxypeptidase regulatory-like domain-containing protein [Candidatus Acidoferrales bacterium]